MNWLLIKNLMYLRYRLIWAKTRSDGGKIVLFGIGCVFLVLFAALLLFGGFSAGVSAIRLGNAEGIAEIILSALFISAMPLSLIIGFGINDLFADAELRRFPLKARERFVVRHLLGFADPYWVFILAVQMGLVAGMHVYGSFSWQNGIIATCLLSLCAYLAVGL